VIPLLLFLFINFHLTFLILNLLQGQLQYSILIITLIFFFYFLFLTKFKNYYHLYKVDNLIIIYKELFLLPIYRINTNTFLKLIWR